MRPNLQTTLVLLVIAASAAAPAQVPADAGTVLREMASHAAVIFTGQVVEVNRSDAAGFVDVRFRIDQAIRGCPRAGFYVLREWAGLWIGHPARYAVGQRRLMLLAARGPAGMSAPIGGTDGAIPLLATGAAPLANAAGVAPADTTLAPSALAADLRWLQARAPRPTMAAPATPHARIALGRPVVPYPDAPADDWSGPVAPLHTAGATAAVLAPLTAVLALLHSSSGAGDARF